ncbi:MAG: roadblock/LC7 domain-containing protein [Promethearchaeota archaeon]
MSVESDEVVLRKIIHGITQASPGIKHVVLMDRTGLLVTSESKFAIGEADLDKIGAISGALYQAGEEQGVFLDLGELDIQILQFQKGILFAISCGSGILCITADKNVQIGLITAIMRRYQRPIGKLLSRLLESDEEVVSAELRSLFSDSVDLF